jgi:hypothetical protein
MLWIIRLVYHSSAIDKHNLSFAKQIASSAAVGNSSPINGMESRFVFSVQAAN